ncbi:MarR family winged helix-turn-helix transcriptional regulator [Peribacillus deserti]|uniref:MarR family transcriptional regulator n=1 Tax=Peribacillus deserti TaxID=673318 RepID=A0A2N5M0M5_9BACI|nr:MarR family transcriptional regulator [Peribacillus deserti]PLT27901.1 MarR family transcriptional regulator [Peribacillus deserti]
MVVMDFKNTLWNYTRKISENTNTIIASLSDRYGLTSLQVRILVEIREQGSHTIGTLASRLNMAGTNISTMCKKLEKEGFLERARNPEDERVVKVMLSDQGMAAVTEINKALLEKISSSIKEESETALKDMIAGLEKLNELLEKMK